MNRVMKEAEAVDSFDNSAGNCGVVPWNREDEGEGGKERINILLMEAE